MKNKNSKAPRMNWEAWFNANCNLNNIEKVFSHIYDGVAVTDKNCRIVFFNKRAAKITGYSQEEAMGGKCQDFIKLIYNKKPVFNESLYKTIKEKKISKPIKNITYIVRKDSSKHTVLGSIFPVIDKTSKVSGMVIVFRDVTKEKEIDIMKTEFVSLASHQLRTPLSVTRWFLEELYNEEIGKLNYEQKDYIKQVLESNQQMIKLVNNLLDVSRLESARVKIEPKPTDIPKLIYKVIDEYKHIAKARNCIVEYKRVKGGIPKIKIDSFLIKEVLGNLVSNSIKYNSKPEQKKVEIKTKKEDDKLLISVKDDGVGIPKKFQKRVFEKFFRADNIVKLDTEGTGFGLYISKLIIEASGGKMWFDSIENQGTTFYFTLPLSGSKKRGGDKSLAAEVENLKLKN